MRLRRHRPRAPYLRVLAVSTLLLATAGCSIRKFALKKLGDAVSEAGTAYASDDDPQLVREALPFSLKLIESLLAEVPNHRGLLLAAASGFTQYSYAYIQQDADEAEDRDLEAAADLRLRARRLYRRALDYGLRGLEVRHRGLTESLRTDPSAAVRSVNGAGEVPFLYWTAASWGATVSLAKDDPDLLADLPAVEALIQRARELEEGYDHGAIHEFLITFEGSRSDSMGGSTERARKHFARAMALSGGQRAAPLVALAETISVRNQDREEFTALLNRALAIDADARPEWRLANLVMQRRARWLLGRADLLFAD